MVQFFHVAHSYGSDEILIDVTLSVESEVLLISGPSGAGKSLLLRLLCGLEQPSRGWISVDGMPLAGATPQILAAHRRRLAVVPRGGGLIPGRSALDNVALALEVSGTQSAVARNESIGVFERLAIEHLALRCAGSLSTGERQWVAVARALVRKDASVFVLDDPTAGIDLVAAARLGEILGELAARGRTVLVTSQHPGLPGLRDHRVALLEHGRIAWDSAYTEPAVHAPAAAAFGA